MRTRFLLAVVPLAVVLANPAVPRTAPSLPSDDIYENARLVDLSSLAALRARDESGGNDTSADLTKRDTDWCELIISQIKDGTPGNWVKFYAADMMNCLKMIPIQISDAKSTLESIRRGVAFHSQIEWLKTAPTGPVDIIAELNALETKLTATMGQYAFEQQVSQIMRKAKDDHLKWDGMFYAGIVQWLRPVEMALVSVSYEGNPPKVYLYKEVLTSSINQRARAVLKIGNKDTLTALADEVTARGGFPDGDAGFNMMFAGTEGWKKTGAMNRIGFFAAPFDYPDQKTKLRFKKDSMTMDNFAFPLYEQKDAWIAAKNARGMYAAFVKDSSAFGSLSGTRLRSRDLDRDGELRNFTATTRHLTSRQRGLTDTPHQSASRKRTPKHLSDQLSLRSHIHRTDARSLQKRVVPQDYVTPFVTSDPDKLEVAGYAFKNEGVQFYVLKIEHLLGEDQTAWLSTVAGFLNRVQDDKEENPKLIIDLSTCDGGAVKLAYNIFILLFPTAKPNGFMRFRASPAAGIIGDAISSQETPNIKDLAAFVFDKNTYSDINLKPFADWATLFNGPPSPNGDKFSQIFRQNWEYELQGSMMRDGKPIFSPENMVLLTDGAVTSSCATLAEFLTQDGKVKSVVVGGRPSSKKMAHTGGSKGAVVAENKNINNGAFEAYDILAPQGKAPKPDIFPYDPPIRAKKSTINWVQLIRDPKDPPGRSTYDLVDYADCHLWYTPDMVASILTIWTTVYEVAFAEPGKFQTDLCVQDVPATDPGTSES